MIESHIRALLGAILVAFVLNTQCSEYQNVLLLPASIILRMNKLNLSPVAISQIIQTGAKFRSTEQSKALYICPQTHIAVAVNELNGEVINIDSNICPYSFAKQQDEAEKKRKIRAY